MAVSIQNTFVARGSTGDLTIADVVVSGSDVGIVVLTSCQDSNHANYPVVSITRDGQSFTKIASYEPAGNVGVEAWYLTNANTGTADIVIDFTGALGESTGHAIILDGADLTSFIDDYDGGSGNDYAPSLSVVSSVNGGAIVHLLCAEADITAVGDEQVIIQDYQDQSYENAMSSYKLVSTANTYDMSATMASAQSYAQVAVAITSLPPVADTPDENTGVSAGTSDKKSFVYKVYGNSYITTWQTEVLSEPQFTTPINSLPGQLNVTLARSFEEFGENDDVTLDNRVDCYVYDTDTPSGSLLYRGYISSYQPILNGGKETLQITLLPLCTEMGRHILVDSSDNTTITYNSYDPSTILADVVTKYFGDDAKFNGLLTTDISLTSTTVSYTFNTNTVKEALDKILELAPRDWFYRIDPTNELVFAAKSTSVDHDLIIGQHITSASIQQRSEKMCNQLYFTGGGSPPLYKKYERTGSIATYGKYAKKLVDQRVTVEATADTMADKILDEGESPETKLTLVIADNNGVNSNIGYNIESIKVGQTIRIKNFKYGTSDPQLWDDANWDEAYWDYVLSYLAGTPLTIVRTRYSPNSVEVEVSSMLPIVSKRIEDVNRNLVESQTANNPSAPST